MGPNLVLTLRVREELQVMAMKEYPTTRTSP